MHSDFKAKYNAVKYDYQRLKSAYTDTGGQVNTIDAQQAFLQFASDLYGLPDWLIVGGRITRDRWESYLSKCDELFLIAKLETINKHGDANKKFWWSKYNDISTNRHVDFDLPASRSDKFITKCKYEIIADGKSHDGLVVAERALGEMENFLKQECIQFS